MNTLFKIYHSFLQIANKLATIKRFPFETIPTILVSTNVHQNSNDKK